MWAEEPQVPFAVAGRFDREDVSCVCPFSGSKVGADISVLNGVGRHLQYLSVW